MYYVIEEVYTNMYCEWPNGTFVSIFEKKEDARRKFKEVCNRHRLHDVEPEEDTDKVFVMHGGEIRCTWGHD